MEYLLPLLAFAGVAAFTPGPNNIMIMASGLNFGVKRSLPHYFGICLGFPIMLSCVGLGIGVLFELYPSIHTTLQVVGILYLFYLAYLIAVSAGDEEVNINAQPQTFFQAALFQWVNPKAWVMGTSALAAYTSTSGDIRLQTLTIIVVFTSMTFAAVYTWMAFGVVLQRILKKPRARKAFNWSMSLLLVASMLPIVMQLYIEHF